MTNEIQTERMIRAHEKYKARFEAIHGKKQARARVTRVEDHMLFGDLIDVDVLNKFNVEASSAYVKTYENQLEEFDGDDIGVPQALQLLMPVLLGFFEHIWLLGYLYRDEEAREDERGGV